MDLAAEDFEIYEDGVHQKIDTFTRVSRGGGIGVGVAWKAGGSTTSVMTSRPVAEGATETPPTDDTTVALVFDHLSSESLRLAQRATLDYVPLTGNAEVRVGVFATDPGFRVSSPIRSTVPSSAARSLRSRPREPPPKRTRGNARMNCRRGGASSGRRTRLRPRRPAASAAPRWPATPVRSAHERPNCT